MEMGCAGARQPADDDRPLDLLIPYLGVLAEEVLEQKSVAEEPGEQCRLRQLAGGVQAGLLAQGAAEDVEAQGEVGWSEVLQAGGGNGRLHERRGLQGDGRARLSHHVEDRPGAVGEPWMCEVVQPDRGRPFGAHHTSSTRTTSACGRGGVASGKNQRIQMRPFVWPAVEIQLGCPGSVAALRMVQEQSAS